MWESNTDAVSRVFKTIPLAFIYLAEVLWLSISKYPVVTVEILDSDRHQRGSGCLPLTEKTADKTTEENPSRVAFAPCQTTMAQTTAY